MQRVRRKLTYNGSSRLNGEVGAYITVQGRGLSFYRVGQGVQDMFVVQEVEPDHVVVEILGQSLEIYR